MDKRKFDIGDVVIISPNTDELTSHGFPAICIAIKFQLNKNIIERTFDFTTGVNKEIITFEEYPTDSELYYIKERIGRITM